MVFIKTLNAEAFQKLNHEHVVCTIERAAAVFPACLCKPILIFYIRYRSLCLKILKNKLVILNKSDKVCLSYLEVL